MPSISWLPCCRRGGNRQQHRDHPDRSRASGWKPSPIRRHDGRGGCVVPACICLTTKRHLRNGRVVDDKLYRVAAAPGVAAQMAGEVDRPPLGFGEQLADGRVGDAEGDRIQLRAAERTGEAQPQMPAGRNLHIARRAPSGTRAGPGGRRAERASASSQAGCPALPPRARVDRQPGSRICARSSPSLNRAARKSCSSMSLSAATVKPAAIAWPSLITRSAQAQQTTGWSPAPAPAPNGRPSPG